MKLRIYSFVGPETSITGTLVAGVPCSGNGIAEFQSARVSSTVLGSQPGDESPRTQVRRTNASSPRPFAPHNPHGVLRPFIWLCESESRATVPCPELLVGRAAFILDLATSVVGSDTSPADSLAAKPTGSASSPVVEARRLLPSDATRASRVGPSSVGGLRTTDRFSRRVSAGWLR